MEVTKSVHEILSTYVTTNADFRETPQACKCPCYVSFARKGIFHQHPSRGSKAPTAHGTRASGSGVPQHLQARKRLRVLRLYECF